jgi:hypothetical protein
VSRRSTRSPAARRRATIGLIVFFVVVCGLIAWSEWYAEHVNVPRYEAKLHQGGS